MYDKKLFEKICNATCSFEELEAFTIKINKKQFDLDNPFEKYYHLDRILWAINRYENKEIDDKYLSYWMNAYNWIIMGGFKIKVGPSITFTTWLEWEICDWLDSLSFFDDSEDWFNLQDYKNSFTIVDRIYRNRNEWHSVFAHMDEGGDNDQDIVVLAYNDKTNEFVKIYSELDYWRLDVKFQRLELNELEKRIEELKAKGYQELKYRTWEEEED